MMNHAIRLCATLLAKAFFANDLCCLPPFSCFPFNDQRRILLACSLDNGKMTPSLQNVCAGDFMRDDFRVDKRILGGLYYSMREGPIESPFVGRVEG